MLYFKEWAQRITECVKSKINKARWRAGHFQAEADTIVLRQSLYFLRENSVLLFRTFN